VCILEGGLAVNYGQLELKKLMKFLLSWSVGTGHKWLYVIMSNDDYEHLIIEPLASADLQDNN